MPTSSGQASSHYETLFHASTVDLVVPEISSLPAQLNASSQVSSSRDSLATQLEEVASRDVAFLDEKLFYLVCMYLPDAILNEIPWTPSPDTEEPPSELLRFLGRLQLTMTASFLPPLPPLDQQRTRPPPIQVSGNDTATLAVPRTPHQPQSSTVGGAPPVTPNPYPATNESEERYASVEGVTVWEGEVGLIADGSDMGSAGKGKGREVVRKHDGWQVLWQGELPIAYVRTPIQNPLLSLTASVTLRESPQPTRTHRKGFSIDTASIRSGTDTVRTDGTEYEGGCVDVDEDGDGMAGMVEIDLLGGLSGDEDIMPATRLALSIRQDLSSASHSPLGQLSKPGSSAISPISAPGSGGSLRDRSQHNAESQASSTTLRKSYRRVLSLSSGLKVRMRTLFLPQLLPVNSTYGEEGDSEAERRIVLCVEVENPIDSNGVGFEVEKITVDVGGKGGKASASIVCQPGQSNSASAISNDIFPLRLEAVEQYNLLYAVTIASAPEDRSGQGLEEAISRTLGKGDEQRPVSIIVIGRPYLSEGVYPTNTFSSRWNCTLDLSTFYANLALNLPPPPLSAQRGSSRLSKPVNPVPTNAIAGDKRYSLASLLSNDAANRPPVQSQQQRIVSASSQRPPAPAPHTRIMSSRYSNPPALPAQHAQVLNPDHGLLISVKVLEPENARRKEGLQALEPFSLEVFVANRTEEVRRFRLSVPGRDEEFAGKVREVEKRRRKKSGYGDVGADDSSLRQMLRSYLGTAPAIVPLENDVRCGPLLPGASLSARLRFLALRDGVHKLGKLRITGANEEFDFILSPVLDIVVGQGGER